MSVKLSIGCYDCEQDKKGLFIYKANPSKIFKLNGNLKKDQRDLPRYKAISQCEKACTEDYKESLNESIRDIAMLLNTFGK